MYLRSIDHSTRPENFKYVTATMMTDFKHGPGLVLVTRAGKFTAGYLAQLTLSLISSLGSS